MLGLIITLLIVGLIAGALARLLVPGRQAIGIGGTVLVGLVGSFVGGFLGYALFGKDSNEGAFQPSGLIGSVIGAVIVLLIWQHFAGRDRMSHV
ncbi:MAG TPA: GlsB/YeaQ/YmgE family stress response membrane protein [Jatrophihabitantaceae bacterium]|nr:GlsB/YeaQ/YmgE family stress response membrane protein [Jatrophihabitantaceae bacterium]